MHAHSTVVLFLAETSISLDVVFIIATIMVLSVTMIHLPSLLIHLIICVPISCDGDRFDSPHLLRSR